MNTAILTKLQQIAAELDAMVRDDLARHSDSELAELVDMHLNAPELLLLTSLEFKGGHKKLCLMAGVTLCRERLRRAETELLEASHA